MCNVAMRACAYRKKEEIIESSACINREKPVDFNYQTSANTHTFPSTTIGEAVIFAWANHEFDLTHSRSDIFLLPRIPRRLYDRRNRSTQRTNARMRHTPSPSANVYAECTRICSRIIKNTSVLFDQAAALTGQLTRGADVTFENEADVAPLVIMPLRLWPLIALFHISTRSRNAILNRSNHFKLQRLTSIWNYLHWEKSLIKTDWTNGILIISSDSEVSWIDYIN